jgi:hypothetical protein
MTNIDLFYIELNNPKFIVSFGNKPDIEAVENTITGREYDQTTMYPGELPYYS